MSITKQRLIFGKVPGLNLEEDNRYHDWLFALFSSTFRKILEEHHN
jgi:hypothetical protein